MTRNDVPNFARIASLTRLNRELRQSRTPNETLQAVRRGLEGAYGPVTWIMLSTRGLADGEYRVVQLYLAGADAAHELDPWTQGTLAVQRGGLIGEIIKTPSPQLLQDVDWSDESFFRDSLSGFHSLVAIPLAGDHLPMNWIILLRRGPEGFTITDFEQAVLRASLTASLLESQTLAEGVADAHAMIDTEVHRVGQIQRNLLPDPLPRIPGLELAASYETFGEAGGDLYDFCPLVGPTASRQPWAIFIGDASGHGPSAAVVIAIVQALLHAHPPAVASAAPLLQHLNTHLCRRPIESSFVTAFLATFDPASRRLAFACAGHPPPLLMRASARKPEWLDFVGGYPLGIDASQIFQEASIDLAPGDSLVMYTDGIEEARNPSGDMFGVEGIEVAVRHGPGHAHQIIAALRQAIASHENGRRATDDQTLVALRVV